LPIIYVALDYFYVAVEPGEMFVAETDFDLFLYFSKERSNIIWHFTGGCSNRQSAVSYGGWRGIGQIVT